MISRPTTPSTGPCAQWANAPADLSFPHVNQVWLIERYTHDPTGAVAVGLYRS